MPFGLKNAGATYQRLMNKMFTPFIGKSMEVYVDDMLVKSRRASDHVKDLRDCFNTLRQYKITLKPTKCAFEVESGKFLRFMVNHRGIEINPVKAQAVVDLLPPRTTKEIQRLTGMIAALSRFVSQSNDKCFSFFQALKGKAKIDWDGKCDEAFKGLKEYLASPPLLSKSLPREVLYVYLAVFEKAVSSVLVREEDKVQYPVYYNSKVF